MKLGEVLVTAGIITPAQLEDSLRAQVRYGARLGTNLVEQITLGLDILAAGLARQHLMPPALRRHFERADPRLQGRLSPELAGRHGAIPLGHVGGDLGAIAIAVMDPLSADARAELEDRLGGTVIPAVAGELRIRYYLERFYGITRGNRFMRVRHASNSEAAPVEVPAATPPRAERAPSEELEESDRAAPARARTDDGLAEDSFGEVTLPFGGPRRQLRPGSPAAADLDLELDGAPPAPAADVGLDLLDEAPGSDVRLPLRPRLPLEAPVADTELQLIDGPPLPSATPPLELGELGELELLEDELGADPPTNLYRAVAPAQTEAEGRERRRFVRTLSDVDEPEPATLGRISIQRVALAPDGSRSLVARRGLLSGSVAEAAAPASLADTLREMRRATGRDRIGDLVVAALRDHAGGAFDAAMVLVVRAPIAIGWKGFVRKGDDAIIEQLAVPLDHPSLIQRACNAQQPRFGPASDPSQVDSRLWAALGAAAPEEILCAPVVLREEVVCVVYGHARAGTAAVFGADATHIVESMASAFERLLRAAER